MCKIYNKAFKFGVAFNVVLFVVLNIASFVVGYREHNSRLIRFAPHNDFPWGVPFDWSWGDEIGLGFALNIFAITACSFTLGFVFRFALRKVLDD